MGHTSHANTIFCAKHETMINGTKQLAIQNIHCLREAKKIFKKRITKDNLILRVRKKIMQPVHSPYCPKVCSKLATTTAIPIATNNLVTTCYPYQQSYTYPLTLNDWNHLHSPLFTVRPVPVIIPTSSPIFTQITPLVGTVVQPILSPILPQTFVQEHVANISNYTEYNYSAEQFETIVDTSNEQAFFIQEDVMQTDHSLNNGVTNIHVDVQTSYDDLDAYLRLPKELFPTASMLALDPNPIIDEFCKIHDIQPHIPWILDLEFGIPKSPITRPIPTYNVKFNSIHCKNTPDAIHPGFESCDPDFKKVMLFYYDCVVSAWYKGYMIMHCDRSVENFQSWLLRPMQVLGMCWP